MFSIKSLNPSFALEPLHSLTRASSSPLPPCLSPSLRLKPPPGRVSLSAPKGLLLGLRSQSIVVYAASDEESKHSEIDVDKETVEESSNEAEKAKNDLTESAKEISEEGNVHLSTAAENSPNKFKEIFDRLSSSDKVLDFDIGIPYGIFLSVGGFLSFMLTGSLSAIRFGVILGGALLALSVSSLKSYERGKSSPIASKGQAVISSVLFLRELSLLVQRSTLGTFLTTFLSGTVVAFYMYKLSSTK